MVGLEYMLILPAIHEFIGKNKFRDTRRHVSKNREVLTFEISFDKKMNYS